MDRLNEQLLVTFPDTLSIAGVEYECISPPREVMKTMTQGPFDVTHTARFQMRKADYLASKLGLRQPFESQGVKFELKNYQSDANDTMVTLVASVLQ